MSIADDARAEYMGHGDPALKTYYPDVGRCRHRRRERQVRRSHDQVAVRQARVKFVGTPIAKHFGAIE